MSKVKLSSLTAAEKQQLLKELEEQQAQDAKRIREERIRYKQMVNDEVSALFPELKKASSILSEVKKTVFDNLQTLIKMKAELYDKEEEQTSHSFTNTSGEITIIIGYNMIDGWDDTANTGIAKVHEYMQSRINDKDSQDTIDALMKLLSKDSKGNLKASRVLQLKQWADKSGDKTFIDGIQIIQDAYRPVRSKEYVRCEYKATNGEKVVLPLSITEAGWPEPEATTAK